MRRFHVIGKKIIGVGHNYRSHIEEIGAAMPKEPLFFLKPTTSYILEPYPIRIPEGHEVHHEVELGVVIGKKGANIPANQADKYIAGYCLALDLTARDVQVLLPYMAEAKRAGHPWTVSKGYDTFCPISTYMSKNIVADHQNVKLWLKVNGELRQDGNTRDMIFPINDIIAKISQIMRLEPGDMILTGTPSGVGPLKVGDTVVAGVGHDYMQMRFKVVPKPQVLRN